MTTRTHHHGIPPTPGGIPATECGHAVRWRRRQLLSAGYDELSARRLAADPDIDVHVLLNLVEAGHPDLRSRAGHTDPGLGS